MELRMNQHAPSPGSQGREKYTSHMVSEREPIVLAQSLLDIFLGGHFLGRGETVSCSKCSPQTSRKNPAPPCIPRTLSSANRYT